MDHKQILIALAFASTLPRLGHAQEVQAQAPPRISIIDSNFSLRGRNQHDNSDRLTRNQLQYNVDMKVQLRLDRDGKWRLVSRTKTGASFESGWNDLGVGNNTQFARDLNVRQIYMQYESDGTTASVGFLPVLPDSSVRGMLSYDDDGWIDGARLESTALGGWAKRVTVTVGRIDELDTPAALSRGIETPNVIQIHIQGNLSPRLAYVVEGTQFDSDTAGSEQYMRALLELATKDVITFLDKIVVEPLLINSSRPIHGFAVGAQEALNDTWSLTLQYSFKSEELSAGERNYAPRDDFFREGHQIGFMFLKKFTSIPVEWSIGAGKTVAARGQYLGVVNTQGLRVDTRLKVKF